MFRRDAFVLLALGVFGIVFTIYIVIGSTPFFPKSLQTQAGECPVNRYAPAEPRPVLEEFEADWYSSALLGLHEEPLFPQREQRHRTVRFTLLRSFHAPLTISTSETENGQLRISGTWSSGADGCETAPGGCRISRVLSEQERARLTSVQSLLRKRSYGCWSGVDGSMWIVESSGRGSYRFWSEWSPQNGELRNLAVVMIELSGWDVREIY